MSIIRDVPVEIGFSSLARAQLYHVRVCLDHRDASAEVEKLLPSG